MSINPSDIKIVLEYPPSFPESKPYPKTISPSSSPSTKLLKPASTTTIIPALLLALPIWIKPLPEKENVDIDGISLFKSPLERTKEKFTFNKSSLKK